MIIQLFDYEQFIFKENRSQAIKYGFLNFLNILHSSSKP